MLLDFEINADWIEGVYPRICSTTNTYGNQAVFSAGSCFSGYSFDMRSTVNDNAFAHQPTGTLPRGSAPPQDTLK